MNEQESLQYQYYLADQLDNVNAFINSLYVQLSSPLTKPEALPTILKTYGASLYLNLSKAAKHEPLELI